jgi:ribosomal protein S25
MSTQPLDYAAIIADLEAKKAAIEATISSLRSAMALGTLGAGQGGDVSGGGASPTFANPYSMSGGEVPAGAFLGKSIPEAARVYLEIVKKKQTSREIAEALLKGGIESTSNNFISIVHAILDRARKSPNASIVKLGTQWGLAGWYPKGILNNVAAAMPPKKKGKKTKKNVKAAAKPSKSTEETGTAQPPSEQTTAAQPPTPGTRDRLTAILKQSPGQEFTAEVLAEKVGQRVQIARMVLAKLVSSGVIHKSESGAYQAVVAA